MPSIYERKPGYWTRDLSDRSFEQAVKEALEALGWEYEDNTGSLDRPDLYISRPMRGKTIRVALELKEKRQPYRARWTELAGLPEEELLVLDEVSARKLLGCAPRALVLFWDRTQPDRPYVLYTVIDLFCLPRRRVQRAINLNTQRYKAKWLLDGRQGHAFKDLNSAFAFVANYLAHGMLADLRRLEAHGGANDDTVETL